MDFSGSVGFADADGEGHGEAEGDHEGGGCAGDGDLVGCEGGGAEVSHEEAGAGEGGDFAEHLQAGGEADVEEAFEVGWVGFSEPAVGDPIAESGGEVEPDEDGDEDGGAGDEGCPGCAFEAEGGAAEFAEDHDPVEEDVEGDAAEEDPEGWPWAVEGIGVVFEGDGGEGRDARGHEDAEEGLGAGDDFGWLAEDAEVFRGPPG